MAESFKSSRIKFKKSGDQRKFILNAKNKLDLNYEQFSQKLGICSRTLRDWEKEKFNMPLSAMSFICKKLNIEFPKGIKIIDKYWYVAKGAKKGGMATFKKYGVIGGSQEIRKEKWREWWGREGKFKENIVIGKRKTIKKPKKSKDLAEFVGIMLGDGGISKMQIAITLHRITDRKYNFFIRKLIKKLFSVIPGKYCKLNSLADSIVVSRAELVDFCVNSLGLKIGNKVKQQVDIPLWIRKNKNFEIACVRGLVDTDGSVFTHRYKSKGKYYSYKKLSFTSLSKPIILSVYDILRKNGLNPRICRHKDVRLDSRTDMEKYFRIFGSSNHKHLKRYEK